MTITNIFGISNIAYESLPNGHSVLQTCDISQVELAPTTLCPWTEFTAQTVLDYETQHNVKVFSLQSVFYGTNIVIARNYSRAFAHLCKVLDICTKAHVPKITFGSPRARTQTCESDTEIIQLLVKACATKFPNVNICIEPNATEYGCTYLTTLEQALDFVKIINLPNVKIQLDVGNLILEQDSIDVLKTCVYRIGAVHISDKQLGPILTADSHKYVAQFLQDIEYSGHISLEMRQPETLADLVDELETAQTLYKHVIDPPNLLGKSCLVGFTGFVGANLRDQIWFDEYVNRDNLDSIRGHSFRTIYFAAMPGSMWFANSHPQEDLKAYQLYKKALETVHAHRFVLISSMNVYGNAQNVTEVDIPKPCTAYGRHRRLLEQFVQKHFQTHFIVRLPGLFGPHLKKNAVYDIAHNHRLEHVNLATSYQWYDLQWLRTDLQKIWAQTGQRCEILNITTPLVSTREIAALSTRDTRVCRDEPTMFRPHICSKHGYLRPIEQVKEHIQKYFRDSQ